MPRAAAAALRGQLQKQSPAFPYVWQSRHVEVVGEALLYKSGGGAQKAISLREVRTISLLHGGGAGAGAACDFEVATSTHSYKFRAPTRAVAMQWVNGLQQRHMKAR